jgi:hypothetical protein
LPEAITYHPRVTHSLPYYHAVLLVFIEGLTAKKTYQQIADLLNLKGLLSPSGKHWSPSSVKQAIFKLRNHKIVPSRLHTALLQLCFDGTLRPSQTFVLFEMHEPGVM